MKATVNRKDLQHALKMCKSALWGKSSMPILCCVRIEVDAAGEVRLLATDIENRLQVRLSAAGCEPGACVAPCATLAKIVGGAKAPVALLESGGTDKAPLLLLDGASLACLDPEEFPTVAPVPPAPEAAAELDGAEFARALARAARAASADDTRYNLCGVAVDLTAPSHARYIGLDGPRMHVVPGPTVPGWVASEDVPHPILTLKTVRIVEALVGKPGKNGAPVRAVFAPGAPKAENSAGTNPMFACACGSATLVARLIDGGFPAWRAVLDEADKPPGAVADFTAAGAAALLDAVKAVRAATAGERRLRLSLPADGPDGLLRIEADDADCRATRDVAAHVVTFAGAPSEIALNGRFLTDALAVVDAPVRLVLPHDGADPVLLHHPDGFLAGTGCIITPMRKD